MCCAHHVINRFIPVEQTGEPNAACQRIWWLQNIHAITAECMNSNLMSSICLLPDQTVSFVLAFISALARP